MSTWSSQASWGRGVARFAAVVLSGLATGALVVGVCLAAPYLTLSPPADYFSLRSLEPASQRSLVLHAANGEPFARRGGCVAESVTLEEVPRHFIDALLSMEDRRFYYHFGIDAIGVARAAVENHAAGRIVQGGSTITQQLVKFSLLSSDRTMERKEKEAWLALALELRLSKDEILERYMSSAYFGDGCFGLRAAAKKYFDTPVSKLTLPQSVYLVGLLRSPTSLARNEREAVQRSERVLDAMVANRKLTPERRALLSPANPVAKPTREMGSYYADWIASTLKVPRTGDYSPLPIYTTFEPQLQKLAEQAIEKILGKSGEARGVSQAAMVVMRPDGRVVAMVGGRNYSDSQFNRAVQAKRQPGSSFKLFVYLAALRGGLKTESRLVDRPISIGDYKPENFGHRYRGRVNARQAFASSINTVAVRLSEGVGRQPVIDAARDLGITTPLKPRPSLALGAYEVTLLELTSAYTAVAAGAYPITPWAITGTEGPGENAFPPKDSGQWQLKEQKDLLTLLHATVATGTGRRAQLPITSYGKTGTSQNFRDAWFMGFAGNLVAGMWIGNDDYSPMKQVTGGNLPAEIWATFMRDVPEVDEEFERELPHIVAFPAKMRKDKPEVKLASSALASDGEESQRNQRARRFDFLNREPRKKSRFGRGFLRGLFR